MRLVGVVVAAFIWAVPAFTGTTAAVSDRHAQVLLLYAESRLAPAFTVVDAAFRSTITSGFGAPVDFRTEFLDLPATPNPEFERHLRDLIRSKYRDLRFDQVMAFGPRGLRMARHCGCSPIPAVWSWSRDPPRSTGGGWPGLGRRLPPLRLISSSPI